jgi:hypothetical protein
MNDYVQKPNTGSMFLSNNKKTERSPDFYGSIKIDAELLKDMLRERTDVLVEIKLSAWKKATKDGKPWLSLSVDTYKKQEAAAPADKDPWEL